MTQVVFTVSGTHTLTLPPERALLSLAIAHEGPAPDQVYADTAETHRRISTLLEELHDPDNGPLRSWSSGQVRTWSHRPWSQDGSQLPLVYDAAVDVRARFSDFGRLGDVVAAISGWSGVNIEQIGWQVTEETRTGALREARVAAVRDAEAKATEYAAALGLGAVRPVEIADAGMLQGVTVRDPGGVPMHARMAASAPSVEFRPDDIEIAVGVDARFIAD